MDDGITSTGCAIIILLGILSWAIIAVIVLIVAHALGIVVWVPA